jgi:hypothetical protein
LLSEIVFNEVFKTEIEAFAIGVFIALVILPVNTIWQLAFILIRSSKKSVEKNDFIIISDYSFA